MASRPPPPPPPPRPPAPRPPPPPPPPQQISPQPQTTSDNHNDSEETRLTAAADLIKTLDSAYAEMSLLSASAAKDAEDARHNARAAAEVARRYTARSYPSFPISPPSSSSQSTTPMRDTTNWNSAPHWTPTTAATPDSAPINAKTSIHTSPPSAALPRSDSPSSARKRKSTNKPTFSTERLAQSHAEDVLSLSMELERTKQALDQERSSTDEIRKENESLSKKNAELERQMEKLLNDMEKQREDSGRQKDSLDQELSRAKLRVEAAEEDAQAALDLAKSNAENLEEVEEWLQKALVENQLLREQLQQIGVHAGSVMPTSPHTPPNQRKGVRFAAQPTVVPIPNRADAMMIPAAQSTPPQKASPAMVSTGRSLLRRAVVPAQDNVHLIQYTPEKSAERRQQLNERLKSLVDDVQIPTPTKASPGGADTTKAMDTCQSVANLLMESGKRLGLNGHWWTRSERPEVGEIDSMTRHYCHSVEAKVVKQHEEIKELSSLCGYLETKLVVGMENGDRAGKPDNNNSNNGNHKAVS